LFLGQTLALIPLLIKIGTGRKSGKEGTAIQKILVDEFFIFWVFLKSTYSHIMDKLEIRHIDAKIFPIKLLFFEISETKMMIPEDINNFKNIYCIFISLLKYLKWFINKV